MQSPLDHIRKHSQGMKTTGTKILHITLISYIWLNDRAYALGIRWVEDELVNFHGKLKNLIWSPSKVCDKQNSKNQSQNFSFKTFLFLSSSFFLSFFPFIFGPKQHVTNHLSSSNFTQWDMTNKSLAWKFFNVMLLVNHNNPRKALKIVNLLLNGQLLLKIVNFSNMAFHTPIKLN